jgi:hypothetical protein
MKKRLFALFVGINQYAAKRGLPPLRGAEPDASGFAAYLKETALEFDFRPLELLGAKANRAAISDAIQRHLGQARQEDVALFYFSGHGLRETTPLAFGETEGTLAIESLACFDSYSAAGIHGLANKELRYLLNQAARNTPHLAVITDCCHSAKTTRSGLQPLCRTAEPWVAYPKLPPRTWQDFVFAEAIPENKALSAQALEALLPEAPHVHLAACQANESAFEVGAQGVFTEHMLEVLRQSSGAISYYQLRERINTLIRSRARQYEQTPNVYQSPLSFFASDAFLGLTDRKSKIFAAVSVGQNGVRINRGNIHGIPFEDELQEVAISIFEKGQPEAGEVASASIVETELASSRILLFPPGVNLPPDKLYEAKIEGLYQRDFNVALWGSAADEEGKARLREAFKEAFQKDLQETPGANTDCVVVLSQGRMALAHPDSDYESGDESKFLPLAQQQQGYSAASAAAIVQQLLSIAQCEFVRNISQRTTEFRCQDFEFKIEIGQGMYPTRSADWKDGNCFEIHLNDAGAFLASDPGQKTKLFFTIKNNAETPLHFSLMYLSQLFGIYPGLLDRSAMSLIIDPGKSIERSCGFTLEPFIQEFNQPHELGLFRLFIANQAFNLKELEQDPLPPPQRGVNRGAVKKGVNLGDDKHRSKKPDWAVFDFPCRIINEDFKP